MSGPEGPPSYLNANTIIVGVRGDEVTLTIHGTAYRMSPGRARGLAARLRKKADIADGRGR